MGDPSMGCEYRSPGGQRCADVFTGDGEKHVCVRKRRHFLGGTDHKCNCGKKWG